MCLITLRTYLKYEKLSMIIISFWENGQNKEKKKQSKFFLNKKIIPFKPK